MTAYAADDVAEIARRMKEIASDEAEASKLCRDGTPHGFVWMSVEDKYLCSRCGMPKP